MNIIPQDEVFARYENGLRLMRHYFSLADKLLLIDNTSISFTCLEAEKGKITFQHPDSPKWVQEFLASFTQATTPPKSLSSIEEVRNLYRSKKSGNEGSGQLN